MLRHLNRLILIFLSLPVYAQAPDNMNMTAVGDSAPKSENHDSQSSPAIKENLFDPEALNTLVKTLTKDEKLKLQIWSWPRGLKSVIPITEEVLKKNNYGYIQVTKHNEIVDILNILTDKIKTSDFASDIIQKNGINTTEALFEFHGANGQSLSVRLSDGLELGEGSYFQFKMADNAANKKDASPFFYAKDFDQLIEKIRTRP